MGKSPWGLEGSDMSEQLNTVGLEEASNVIMESRTEENSHMILNCHSFKINTYLPIYI